jgi:FkbM family methyltransferase
LNQVAIYGVGAFGKIFYDCLNKDADFFIDDFYNKSIFDGKFVKELINVDKNTKIYISVLQYSKKIESDLLEKGFKNIVSFTDSIKEMPDILVNISKKNYLWLVSEHERMINEYSISKVELLLKDEYSRKLLQKIVNLRKTLDIKYYIDPSDTEYFPSDVPILENLEQINFIDCGAYIGDTIQELTKQSSNINYTISFEPDSKNLIKLQEQLSSLNNKNNSANFLVYPAGVYSKNDILKFSNNGIDSSASLDDTSKLKVPVVSLDTILLNSSPNYIKMDIEGAEKKAILGAKQTIQKYKPNLAICLYHKPEDLWELPLLINELEPSYEMYIRVHEDMCLSTVLYCISKDK